MSNGRRFQRHRCAGGCGGSRAKVVRCIRGDRLHLTGVVAAVSPPLTARLEEATRAVVAPLAAPRPTATPCRSWACCSAVAGAVTVSRHRSRSLTAEAAATAAVDLCNRIAGQCKRPMKPPKAISASRTSRRLFLLHTPGGRRTKHVAASQRNGRAADLDRGCRLSPPAFCSLNLVKAGVVERARR
jgi:hypothetical protein